MGDWRAQMNAHCGMGYYLERGTRGECRSAIGAFLAKRRAEGFTVTLLERGERWELTEPEDSAMVPDTAGFLELIPPERYACSECGGDYEDEDDALRCCEPLYPCASCETYYVEQGDAEDCLGAHLDSLERSELIDILERNGFQCYDSETTGELATAIGVNIRDGSIPFPDELS